MKEEDENIIVKDYLIDFYEHLMENAVEKEEYENAAKYKRFIENLKKSGDVNGEKK